jgi:hypothetical protein
MLKSVRWTSSCTVTVQSLPGYPRGEDTLADKSPESEVVGEDDVDSSAGRGVRDSGRPLRPQAFAMGGFDSGAYSFAHILSYHSSHGKG